MCRCRTRSESRTRSSSAGTMFPAVRRWRRSTSPAGSVARPDVELIGVAGRHRRQPDPAFRPPIDVRSLPLARPWLYETWNRFEWPPVERATGAVDVCHSTIAIPAATKAPHVVTVHDVAFVRTPERFTAHGVRVMKAGLERCRRADLVLCPSVATLGDLVELGFDERRIRARAVGGRGGARVRRRRQPACARRTRCRSGSCCTWERSSRARTCSRLARATASLDEPLPLVVAGAPGWGERPTRRTDEARVRFLGFVPEHDLPALYAERDGVRLPEPRRGVRDARRRGDGLRAAGRDEPRHGDGGDRRRRGRCSSTPATSSRSASGLATALDEAPRLAARGRARAAELSWDAAAEATRGGISRGGRMKRARRRGQPAVARAGPRRRLGAVPRAPAGGPAARQRDRPTADVPAGVRDRSPRSRRAVPDQRLPLDRDWRGMRILAEHTWLAARTLHCRRRAPRRRHGAARRADGRSC